MDIVQIGHFNGGVVSVGVAGALEVTQKFLTNPSDVAMVIRNKGVILVVVFGGWILMA